MSLLRRILPYMSVPLVIAALYAAFAFYSRKAESAEADQQIAQKSAEQAREDVARLGGDALKITAFYAAPPAVARGQSSRICYGVVNADLLELAPPVEKVWPSLSRCFDVSPRESTTYRLSAHGRSGVEERSLTITVQ